MCFCLPCPCSSFAMATSFAKPSKRNKAEVESFVVALNKKGIKLLAVDFDRTLIDIHSGGMWSESVDKLASHTRPCMKDLLEMATNKNLFVAIVTYHRQGWLIKDVLHTVLPKKVANKIYVQANTPEFMERQRASGASVSDGAAATSSGARSYAAEMSGKEAHIASIIAEIQKDHNVIVKSKEIILMDDDICNVRIACSFGHYAFQVQQNVDYSSFASFETMLLL